MITVISSKDVYAAKRLQEEAGIMNYELEIMELKDLITVNFNIPATKADVLYVRNPYLGGKSDYLPKIVNLANKFIKDGGRVVDANIAQGDLGLGKWEDYEKLKSSGISMPEARLLTSHLPSKVNSFPFIIKWIYGMKAKATFLIRAQEDIKKIPTNIVSAELMVQEYIKPDYEYKVITVGYKALPVILRFKVQDSGFGMDFEKYQTLKTTDAPLICRLAEKASKVLGRELAKVDILEKNGRLYILEVNRFPGLETFESLTGFNVFKEFLEYLGYT